jgi:hypothetical protein
MVVVDVDDPGRRRDPLGDLGVLLAVGSPVPMSRNCRIPASPPETGPPAQVRPVDRAARRLQAAAVYAEADLLEHAGGLMERGVPAGPVVTTDEIWLDSPNVLVDGDPYTIGWQRWPEKKGGPSFVTVRRVALGGRKVIERYPLTPEGWERAWHALVALDPVAAQHILPVLARRAEAAHGEAERRELDARSLACLSEAVFAGGYLADGELSIGQTYELRFLEDRLSVFEPGRVRAAAEFRYPDISAAEITGPGRIQRWSAGQQAMIAGAFGLAGAVAAVSSTRVKTFVRIQTADSELFFLHTVLPPDELRIHLARGIGAVRQARELAAGPDDIDPRADAAPVVTELSRLAGLLEAGLLTRPEFDQLKAMLLAGQPPDASR